MKLAALLCLLTLAAWIGWEASLREPAADVARALPSGMRARWEARPRAAVLQGRVGIEAAGSGTGRIDPRDAERPPWVLLDAAGRPLLPADERWLRLEEEAPDDAALDALDDSERDRVVGEAKMVAELSGSFVLDVTKDLRWRVVRGGWLLATTRPEPEPDGEIRIDVPALRRRMGTLAVEVMQTETQALLPEAIVEIRALDREASGRVWFRPGSEPTSEARALCFAGLPEGRYEIAVQAVLRKGREWGRQAVVHADVRGEATTHVRLEFPPSARVPFRLRDEDGETSGFSETSIEYRDAHDRRLVLSVDGRDSWRGENGHAVVTDAPPGRGWLVWRGNTWEVRATSGVNSIVECPVREPKFVAVLVPIADPSPAHFGMPVLTRARTREGVTVAEDPRSYHVDRNGLLDLCFELVPGTYDVEWLLPTGETGSAPVEVPEGEDEVVLYLR